MEIDDCSPGKLLKTKNNDLIKIQGVEENKIRAKILFPFTKNRVVKEYESDLISDMEEPTSDFLSQYETAVAERRSRRKRQALGIILTVLLITSTVSVILLTKVQQDTQALKDERASRVFPLASFDPSLAVKPSSELGKEDFGPNTPFNPTKNPDEILTGTEIVGGESYLSAEQIQLFQRSYALITETLPPNVDILYSDITLWPQYTDSVAEYIVIASVRGNDIAGYINVIRNHVDKVSLQADFTLYCMNATEQEAYYRTSAVATRKDPPEWRNYKIIAGRHYGDPDNALLPFNGDVEVSRSPGFGDVCIMPVSGVPGSENEGISMSIKFTTLPIKYRESGSTTGQLNAHYTPTDETDTIVVFTVLLGKVGP